MCVRVKVPDLIQVHHEAGHENKQGKSANFQDLMHERRCAGVCILRSAHFTEGASLQPQAYHIVQAIIYEDISTEGILLHITPSHSDRHPQLDVADLHTKAKCCLGIVCRQCTVIRELGGREGTWIQTWMDMGGGGGGGGVRVAPCFGLWPPPPPLGRGRDRYHSADWQRGY